MKEIEKINLFMQFVIKKGIVKNQEEFGVSLGYKNKSSFSQLLKREKVTDSFKDKMIEKYPDYKEFSIASGSDLDLETRETDSSKSNAIIVDYSEMNIMMVPLVSAYAQLGFLNGFDDPEYIEQLPKVPWADDKEHRGEYICIEAKGDSMDNGTSESILDGDILLCRNVRRDFWYSKLHINQWDFMIAHKTMGIIVKRIIKHDVEKGIITCRSLNDYYQDFEVDLRDVAEIRNVVDIKRKHKRR